MGCLPARPCTQTAGTDHRRSGKRSSSRNSARLSAMRIGRRAKPSMSMLLPKSEHTKLRTQRCSNRAYPRASTAVAPQLPWVRRGQADAICARTAHTHAPPPLFFVCMSARASVYASAPLRKIVVKRYTSTPICSPRALLGAQDDTDELRSAMQNDSGMICLVSLNTNEVAALVRRLIYEVSDEDAANAAAKALASSHVCGKTLALCTRDHFANDYGIEGPDADHLVEKRDELVQSGVPRSSLLP